jgi:ferrochelatase
VEEVARLAETGKKRIAVIAPAFSPIASRRSKRSTKRSARASRRPGGEEFTYIPCLNDDDAHIDALWLPRRAGKPRGLGLTDGPFAAQAQA